MPLEVYTCTKKETRFGALDLLVGEHENKKRSCYLTPLLGNLQQGHAYMGVATEGNQAKGVFYKTLYDDIESTNFLETTVAKLNEVYSCNVHINREEFLYDLAFENNWMFGNDRLSLHQNKIPPGKYGVFLAVSAVCALGTGLNIYMSRQSGGSFLSLETVLGVVGTVSSLPIVLFHYINRNAPRVETLPLHYGIEVPKLQTQQMNVVSEVVGGRNSIEVYRKAVEKISAIFEDVYTSGNRMTQLPGMTLQVTRNTVEEVESFFAQLFPAYVKSIER